MLIAEEGEVKYKHWEVEVGDNKEQKFRFGQNYAGPCV